MNPVNSTHASHIGYDEASKMLRVRWHNGKVSAYSGVPKQLADQVMQAPSVGKALHGLVRGQFAHRYE